MIESVNETDILEELKRGYHVFIDIPLEGGQAALDYHSENGSGYGLLAYLQEEHDTLQLGEQVPAHKRYTGNWADAKDLIGDMVDVYDESEDVTWHFVYTHTLEGGHIPEPHWDYELITSKLDAWWEEHEEDIPFHGVIAVRFGTGPHHARVGEYKPKANIMLKVMADSEVPFNLRYA